MDAEDMPITSVAMLADPIDPQRLEGRDVRLTGVEIVEVLGDTAFYVAQPMDTAPGVPGAPGAPEAAPGAPGATPPAQQTNAQPGQDRMAQPGAHGTDERVLVMRDEGLLGGMTNGIDDDAIRVGQRVNVHGEVRMRDDYADDMRTDDRAMRDRTADDPAMQQRGTDDRAMQQDQRMHGATGDVVYVAADRVERHATGDTPGAAPRDRGAGPGGQPGTAPGDAGADQRQRTY